MTEKEKAKPLCYISPKQIGTLITRERMHATVRALPVGDCSVALYLKPPPPDDALVLLLTGLDLIKGLKGAEYKQWAELARAFINPPKTGGAA